MDTQAGLWIMRFLAKGALGVDGGATGGGTSGTDRVRPSWTVYMARMLPNDFLDFVR